MQLTHTLVALFSTSALAATLSTFASTEWTLESLVRVCDGTDDSCTWTFGINTNEEGVDPTACTYDVGATSTEPASQSNGGPVTCGAFTVTSGVSNCESYSLVLLVFLSFFSFFFSNIMPWMLLSGSKLSQAMFKRAITDPNCCCCSGVASSVPTRVLPSFRSWTMSISSLCMRDTRMLWS